LHPWFWSSFLGWIAAQTIKLVRAAIRTGTIDFEYLLSTGGMPSAHSAMVTALAVSIGLTEGFGTPIAMLGLGFASVTMFDAATVRRAAGNQARVLHRLAHALVKTRHLPKAVHLRELLGHTRTEVLWGMLTGMTTAAAVCFLWPS
jgi:acid phosphatase family membrane protein YuiD